MALKRNTLDQIIEILRETEVRLSEGEKAVAISQSPGGGAKL